MRGECKSARSRWRGDGEGENAADSYSAGECIPAIERGAEWAECAIGALGDVRGVQVAEFAGRRGTERTFNLFRAHGCCRIRDRRDG